MTQVDDQRPPSHNPFEIYKRGQGKYVRFGTVAALALILGLGLIWLWNSVLGPVQSLQNQLYLKAAIVLVLGLAGAYGIFLLVNRPKQADFMILTESEMRKVNWPSREGIMRSTQIVILLTLIFAFMLYIVDIGFVQFFRAIHTLPTGS